MKIEPLGKVSLTHLAKQIWALFSLMLITAAQAHGAIADRANCRHSEAVYQNDLALMQQKPPTHLRLMSSRWVEIVEAARGEACFGTVVLAFDGHEFFQAGRSDDPGVAELIPLLSSWTGFSLANTFDLTATAVILLGIVIGFAGYSRMFPDPKLRMIGAAFFLCLGLAEFVVANVYVFQSSPLIAGIPWVLYYAVKRRSLALDFSAAVLAFSCALSSIVRIGTCLIGMAFLVTLFLVRGPFGRALGSVALISLACLPSFFLEHSLIARRDALLSSLGNHLVLENRHTIWHAIYLGMAFIPNKEIPAFDDKVAFERARSIDPGVIATSEAYEAILRREVIRLAERRPMLVFSNLVAKAGILSLLGMILLFPSRKVLLAHRQNLWMDAAFIAAMVVSSMNAVLVEPRSAYLLTFLCLTSLYSAELFAMGRLA